MTTRERAYGAIPDQSVDRLCALASRLDLAVREDVFGDVAVREVQRSVRKVLPDLGVCARRLIPLSLLKPSVFRPTKLLLALGVTATSRRASENAHAELNRGYGEVLSINP